MNLKRVITIATLSALTVFVFPAYSGEESTEQSTESQPKRPASKAANEREREPRGRELDRCRREARGMRGPERGTFMTECLASDRYEK